MFCFVVGCKPAEPEAQNQFCRILEEVQEYDGLEEILVNPDTPWKAVLCFRDKESATAAQWMLSLNGAEGRTGGEEEGDSG